MAIATKVSLKKVGYSDSNKSGFTSKFWKGWTHGKNFIAHWGRIGTDGQMRSWPTRSHDAAQNKLDDKVSSKLRKGYIFA